MQEVAPKRKVYIEKQLFERIRFGDQDAFRELYELTYTPLYAFLLSYTLNREDAQDLLQDTFIQILKKCHLYQDQGNPMAWMMKIAKNLFLSQCRKEHSKTLNYDDMENDLGFDDMTNVDNRMVLEKMFEILSTDDRNLIIMHDISGLKHKEIAEILDLPLGTVLARYHRGIRKLQKEFSERRTI
ncbi:sigma-70 family RNA polymerase sigma factor [Lachnospiraceae bacterium 3-1]|nr:sigma-70 family RNA polymerase sigma factor [Lachnospiraceae bacterium 3-1]